MRPATGLDAEKELQLARRIAVSAYAAFRYAMHNEGPRGQVMPNWDQLPEEAQDGWFRAVFVVKVETEEASGIPWARFAQSAYEVYAKAVGAGSVAWSTLDSKQHVAWEAAARHILSLFETDDLSEDEVERMEVTWSVWSERKVTHELAISKSL